MGLGIRATNAEIEAAPVKNEIRGSLKGEFIMRPDRAMFPGGKGNNGGC